MESLTGYPRDLLDLDLDLEADLGVDTVKQAEVFAAVRERFAIPRQDNLKLRDFPTITHVIGFVHDNTQQPPKAAAPPEPRRRSPRAQPQPRASQPRPRPRHPTRSPTRSSTSWKA